MTRSSDIAGFKVPVSWPSRVLARTILRFLHDTGKVVCRVPIHVIGRERFEALGQSIVVANHNSLVDTPVLFLAIPGDRRSRTATVGGLDYFEATSSQPFLERLFRNVVIWFIRSAMNVLLIERKGGEYSQIDRIDAMLVDGWSLVVFPEATRSRSGRMGRFRHGAAELARRHGLPVIPAHVDGTDSVLPPGVRWPQAGPLRIAFGDPLHAEEDESAAAFTARLREAITRLAPEVPEEDSADARTEDAKVEVVS
ncbi:MAG: hypothetical protein CMJ34_06400 [Phycisphaerae bacterium]|nr:hypothetical protein [Phycisphaerae bacterium]